MSHTESSDSSSGHTAVPLELQNASEVRLLLTPPAYDCPQTLKVTLRLTVSQSVRLGVESHDIYYSLTVTVLFLWGALSDERTGLRPVTPINLRRGPTENMSRDN
jgi:hypothetical protein